MSARSRVGLMMQICGRSALFDSSGVRVPVTILRLPTSFVCGVKRVEKEGYNAVILCFDRGVVSRNKPQKTVLERLGLANNYVLFESRVHSVEGCEDVVQVGVNHFVAGQYVDIRGVSIGKGTAGVMKRHNFKGMRASHGVSLAHRSQGSTGQCQDPGRVFKGKKMAGRMGNSRVTAQNLSILSVDEDLGIVIVKGNNVPGHKNAFVFVRDAVKKMVPRSAPVPFCRAVVENERVVE